MNDMLLRRIGGSLAAIGSLRDQVEDLNAVIEAILEALDRGGTVYTAGNGGSAAQALHLAEELIGRYRGSRRPLRAICLNADPTAMTCIANDFGFEEIFARQCEALVTRGDVLVALSTSGRSRNIVRAMETAKAQGAAVIGLLGRDGGACKSLCDRAIIIGRLPTQNAAGGRQDAFDSAHIQEAHQVAIHLICEAAELRFLDTDR